MPNESEQSTGLLLLLNKIQTVCAVAVALVTMYGVVVIPYRISMLETQAKETNIRLVNDEREQQEVRASVARIEGQLSAAHTH